MKPTKNTNNRHSELVSESTALLKKTGRSERSPSFSGRNKSGMTDTSSSILGFTLVELIVVITILVILGTIAFTSLSGYSGSARDGTRVSDLANLSKALDITSIKTGSYPTPDNSFSVTYSGGTLWYQGTIGDTVMNIISTAGAKISKKPTDPLNTTKEYTYSKLAYGNAYQIKTDWEGDSVAYLPSSSGLTRGSNLAESRFVPNGSFDWIPAFAGMTNIGFDQAQAASGNPTLTYIKGTYNGVVARTETGTTKYILVIPSLFLNTGTGVMVLSATTSTGFHLHGKVNSGGILFQPNIVFSSGSLPSTDPERQALATSIANAYSGTSLASQSNIQPFIAAINPVNTGSLVSLGGSAVTNWLGGSTGGTPPPPPTTPSLCGTSNGATVASNGFSGSLCAAGSSVTVWSGNGGTMSASTLSWTCKDASNNTGSCSATYSKPTTGTGGQSCDTYDILIGSLTGSYAVWSMCNMGAYTAYASQALTNCGGTANDCDISLRSTIGSYYQWGRNNDVTLQGTPTATLVIAGTLAWGVGHSNFITNAASPYDWIATQNDNLWGGAGTTATVGTFASQGSPAAMQGPCPTGYHVPTQLEWCSVAQSINPALTCTSAWQNDTSLATTLKLPLSGIRSYSSAGYYSQGVYGFYWSSSPSGIYGYYVGISGAQVYPLYTNVRAYGFGVRCLKN